MQLFLKPKYASSICAVFVQIVENKRGRETKGGHYVIPFYKKRQIRCGQRAGCPVRPCARRRFICTRKPASDRCGHLPAGGYHADGRAHHRRSFAGHSQYGSAGEAGLCGQVPDRGADSHRGHR